ncbi:MAG: tetratricopeptide repeat protein [Bacteroidetes bacterium]|nr:tetratricopeptide repeat protein [Bacteroidota bacterium]
MNLAREEQFQKLEEEKTEKEETLEQEISVTNKVDKKELGKEAAKNQEIIDTYREKIEGAVFDKQWDELIELCDAAIKEVPYWDWAYYRRSTAWGHKKEFAKVILDCNKAIGFNPTLADAYYNRGTARFFLGKLMEACDDYQKSIDLNYIKKADAYFNRGLCFQKLDQQKKAYREFLKAKEMGSQKAIEIIKNYYTE